MTEIRINKKIDEIPKIHTNIYRLKGPEVNKRNLLELSKSFNFKGDKRIGRFSITPYELTYNEGSLILNLCRKSGALRYYDSTRWQVDDGASQVKYSENQAIDIANNFIKETKLAPIEDLKLLKITRLRVGTLEKGTERGDERIIDYGIVFKRIVDNLPVEGPGGSVMIYIDYNKEVSGCNRIWRGINKIYRKIPPSNLRHPSYAYKDLERYWKRKKFHNINVIDTQFGYFEFGRGVNQRFLQPVYYMPLQLISNERFTMKSLHVTQAAKKPVGRIMPPQKKLQVTENRQE